MCSGSDTFCSCRLRWLVSLELPGCLAVWANLSGCIPRSVQPGIDALPMVDLLADLAGYLLGRCLPGVAKIRTYDTLFRCLRMCLIAHVLCPFLILLLKPEQQLLATVLARFELFFGSFHLNNMCSISALMVLDATGFSITAR